MEIKTIRFTIDDKYRDYDDYFTIVLDYDDPKYRKIIKTKSNDIEFNIIELHEDIVENLILNLKPLKDIRKINNIYVKY